MFTSTGILRYDCNRGKYVEPWWALLECDDQIANYYTWQLKKRGIEVVSNSKSLWGTHISVMKGETPPQPESWKKYKGFEVEFNYTHLIRHDNGEHAWVDVYSEDLSAIRQELGFPSKSWYHMTIGRLVRPYTHSLENLPELGRSCG
jgi:hypothetical protein